ncbi:MAG TPA: EamA family transporter [Bacteroidales bacterium]|nr:EamA family transporter [Bacteroidales bacterium]
MKNQKLAYLFAGFVILFWGTSATAFKIGLKFLNFIQLLFWASLFAMIILFVVLLVQRKLSVLFHVTRKQLSWSILLGFLNPFLYYFVLFKAYDLLPAQVAQPLNYVWPIILVLLSVPILGHKLKLKNIIALCISFIGVVFISSQGSFSIFSRSNPFGVMLALTSSLVWASFWLLNVKNGVKDEVVKLFISFSFATTFGLIAGSLSDGFWDIKPNGIYAAAYIGAFEMGITFVLWLKALNYAENTARLGNVIYLVPFVALVFISVVLGEHVYWTTIMGLVFIVLGIVYQQLKPESDVI